MSKGFDLYLSIGGINEEMHLASLLNLAFGFAYVTECDEILRDLKKERTEIVGR